VDQLERDNAAVRACAVLGVSRASWYRSQRELAAPQPRPAPSLALSAEQREIEGSSEVELLLSVRHSRPLQPLRGRLDGG